MVISASVIDVEEKELDKPKRKKPGTAIKKVQPLHMNEKSEY